MTDQVHQGLQTRGLLPAEHYLDSGYPSADLIVDSLRDYGITLITPVLLDRSAQARAKAGFDKTAFTIDWAAQQATCPQGATSASWSPATQRGTEVIVVTFGADTCGPCPVRRHCTTSRRGRRQLTLRPRPLHDVLAGARTEQDTKAWHAKYALRAGVEGTIHQAVAITGIRHARCRGLPKIHLQHAFSAVALNLIRLHAYWNNNPHDRTRTSHLARLGLALVA